MFSLRAIQMSNRILVFGSNTKGRHGKGAALTAKKYYGAIQGVGSGFFNQSYAIPTKNGNFKDLSVPEATLPLEDIQKSVEEFLFFAKLNVDTKQFKVCRLGCALAGYTDAEIAPLFADVPPNVIIPSIWQRINGMEIPNRVIVAGSREILNDELVFEYLDTLDWDNCEIVSGRAKGIDNLGVKYAELRGIPAVGIAADWDRFDNAAGYLRNWDMSIYGTHLRYVWDGHSPGTKSMIDIATESLNVDGIEVREESMV